MAFLFAMHFGRHFRGFRRDARIEFVPHDDEALQASFRDSAANDRYWG
jgi:hypothetical protein